MRKKKGYFIVALIGFLFSLIAAIIKQHDMSMLFYVLGFVSTILFFDRSTKK